MKPCPECGGKVHFLDGRNVQCEKCYTVFHFDIDKIGAMGSSLGEEWDKLPRKGEQMKEIAKKCAHASEYLLSISVNLMNFEMKDAI